MDTVILGSLQKLSASFSSEIVLLIELLACCLFLLLSLRFFGKYGLMTFVVVGFLGSNIQVLHQSAFLFLKEPVALGTVLFSLTYIATDMLTEHFGFSEAKKAIGLSIFAQVMFVTLMMITLLYRPLSHETRVVCHSMEILFLPASRLFVASLLSYGLSQLLDVWVFERIRIKTHDRHLWMRSFISTFVSGFVDNVIFSTLAWVVFNPTPVSWNALFWTYILGTYTIRMMISFISVPMMYGSYLIKNKEHNF